MGCHSLLQGIFPTQGWNLGLPHCRQILYQLSYREALVTLRKLTEIFPKATWNLRGQLMLGQEQVPNLMLPLARLPGEPGTVSSVSAS